MAWIEVHQSLPSHKKTLALSDVLHMEPAHTVGHLVCLWTWSIDNAPHGDLSNVLPATIARAAGWPVRKAQQLLDALVESGFLDRRDEQLQIHDYDLYIGKLVARREANVIRTRASRSRDRSRDVRMTYDACNGATQPDSTGGGTAVPPHRTGPPPLAETDDAAAHEAAGPDVAPPRAAATPRQNGTNPRAVGTNPRATETAPPPEPAIIHAEVGSCPLCRLPYTGSYLEHTAEKHRVHAEPGPGNLGRALGRRRRGETPDAPPPEIDAQFAAMHERLERVPPDPQESA